MFDRFSDEARKSMAMARKAAQRLGHDSIGTEHVALGILAVDTGAAAGILRDLGVRPEDLAFQLELRSGPGDTLAAIGQLPFTPRAKKVLELSMDEANSLSHSHLRTVHLLLALLREEGGVAGSVFAEFQIKYEDVRERVQRSGESEQAPPRPVTRTCERCGRTDQGSYQRLPKGRGQYVELCRPCADEILEAWEGFLREKFGIE